MNARLKDEFGGRHLRVRGHGKAYCHLMFGILALSVSQLLRLRAAFHPSIGLSDSRNESRNSPP